MMKNVDYKLWQTEDENQEFLSFKESRFDFSKYELKYKGTIGVEKEKEDLHALEELFFLLNCMHPTDYRTRSLSMSDVIEINDKYYYCDTFGWKELSPELLKR